MTREYSYEDVKASIWEVIKDKTDFVYEPSNECDVCITHSDWENDPDEFGDEPPVCLVHYEHDSCRYFYANPEYGTSDSDAPACVVGNWFKHEDISPEDLSAGHWEDVEGQAIATLLQNAGHLQVDEKAIEFLKNMQTHQDEGRTWGEAFERSAEKAENNPADKEQ